MNFNMDPAQIAAVMHDEGPALVLAGPGSGKTTVITNRAVRITANKCEPSRLLCVTFTNAAAEEMKQRYLKLAGSMIADFAPDASDIPVFSTVHAFCNNIISEYEKRTGIRYVRIEGEDSPRNSIFERIYKKYNGIVPDEAMIERIKGYLRREKDGSGRGAEERPKAPSGKNQIRRFSDIVREYTRVKKENGFIDFDDMVLMSLELLTGNDEIRGWARGLFDYVQVDEAQDLSRAQYEVLRMIAGNANIFIVADDDQSIYGFRGAEPQCLFDFAEEYPDAARYELTRNFRSTPEIVKASAALVSVNKKRFFKDLYTTADNVPDSFNMVFPRDAKAQAMLCAHEALASIGAGESLAVLYRNGVSSLPVRAAFTANGIKYATSGNCPRAWEQLTVREGFHELLKAERKAGIIVPGPSTALRRIIREGFSDRMEEQCRLEGHDRKTVSVSMDFLGLVTDNSVSYDAAVRFLDAVERSDNLSRSSAAGFAPSVMLSTIHSAKGLEYDRVIVIDVLEGEMPGSEAAGDAVEEERRLLYVAMTRARRKLIISCPLRRGMRGEEESRFVEEIVSAGDEKKLAIA